MHASIVKSRNEIQNAVPRASAASDRLPWDRNDLSQAAHIPNRVPSRSSPQMLVFTHSSPTPPSHTRWCCATPLALTMSRTPWYFRHMHMYEKGIALAIGDLCRASRQCGMCVSRWSTRDPCVTGDERCFLGGLRAESRSSFTTEEGGKGRLVNGNVVGPSMCLHVRHRNAV
jgi:hypothetical protein